MTIAGTPSVLAGNFTLRDTGGSIRLSRPLGLHPTGTGPFSFVSYTPNQSIVVKRNEAYKWGPAATGHTGPARYEMSGAGGTRAASGRPIHS